MRERVLPPVHPGEILLEDLMKPLGLTAQDLAEALAVDVKLINRIVAGKARITANTALRLARHFGSTPQFWMNLQSDYDLELAKYRKAEEIERDVTVRSVTSTEDQPTA